MTGIGYLPRRKRAEPIARATDFGPAVMQPYYAPVSHARPSPRNPVPNYMDHYHLPTHDGWMAELAMLADR